LVEKEADFLNEELINQQNLLKQLRKSFLREAMQGKLVKQEAKDGNARDLLEKIKAEKEKLIAEKKLKREKPLLPIKDEEIPFEIPENWMWCRLGEICNFITKGTTPDTNKITHKGEIPYLKVYNIVDQKIDFEYKPQFIDMITHRKTLTRSIVHPGDVLMNIVGPPLGKIAIVPGTYNEWNINQALAIFRPLFLEINIFLYYYLCEGTEIFKLRPLGVVGQDNLSLEQCRNIVFPLPPLAEQNRIVKKLGQLMLLSDELQKAIQQNQTFTQQLLQVALKEALEPDKIPQLN
jgi:type I restriction enzyme S subunit